MNENVSYEERDNAIRKILEIPSNKICFDCGAKDPRWSSPYLGIIICLECSGRHRSYGTHISFVRSFDLDKWKKKFLTFLEISGNEYTRKRFEELKIPKINGFYDYNNELVLKYRKELESKVYKIYGVELPKEEEKDVKKKNNINTIKYDDTDNKNYNFTKYFIILIILCFSVFYYIKKINKT